MKKPQKLQIICLTIFIEIQNIASFEITDILRYSLPVQHLYPQEFRSLLEDSRCPAAIPLSTPTERAKIRTRR